MKSWLVLLVWVALTFALGTAVLTLWVTILSFQGKDILLPELVHWINYSELAAGIWIMLLTLVAWVAFALFALKEAKKH